jgi:glycosyltransferase involved in cell wall biosynthesis
MPPISIDLVICTYNNAPLLKKTLEALYSVNVPAATNWGVIVVNNNCSDETAQVFNQHIAKGVLPIRMVNETKLGLTNARLCGVQNSNADWIAFVDDDCLLENNWLEEAVTFVIDHPECGLFGSRIQLLWEEEPPSYLLYFPFAFAAKNHGNFPKKLKAVAGAGMVVKRQLLHKSGWLNEQYLQDRIGKKLVSGGDMEIALRVGTLSEVWYNPACILQHMIPVQRTTKLYLERILFGLGSSRHHVTSLNWKGSYLSWFLYSCLYSLGMLGMCLGDILFGKKRAAGIRVAISPWLGWNAGMRMMFTMDRQKRKRILGCVAHLGPIKNQQPVLK